MLVRPPDEPVPRPVPRRQRPGVGAAVLFVGVAFGWTWAFLLTAAALGVRAGHPLHLLGLAGPVVAWLCVLRWCTDAGYRRRFLGRVVDVRRVAPRVWLLVAGVGAGLPVAALLVVRGIGGETASAGGLGLAPALGAVAFALTAGLGEEPGWRGVAHDSAASRLSPLSAAVVLGVLWSLWHLPLHLVEGTYQSDLGWGTSAFWAAMLARVPLAVLLVLLVHTSDGAVSTAVVAHALGNAVGELLPGGADLVVAQLAVTTPVAVLAAVLVPVAGGSRSAEP